MYRRYAGHEGMQHIQKRYHACKILYRLVSGFQQSYASISTGDPGSAFASMCTLKQVYSTSFDDIESDIQYVFSFSFLVLHLVFAFSRSLLLALGWSRAQGQPHMYHPCC